MGLKTEYLYRDTKLPRALDIMTRVMDKLSIYTWSEDIPRRFSFHGDAYAVETATKKYIKDKDLDKWIRDSGVEYLPPHMQQFAIKMLLRDNVNMGIPGLENVPGYKAVSAYIARETTNQTMYVYDRPWRARVEQSALGEVVMNLFTFPRSYYMMWRLQAEKMGRGNTWHTRKEGLTNTANLMFWSYVIAGLLGGILGRKYPTYMPHQIMTWEPGGLMLGGATEISQLFRDIVLGVLGEEEAQEAAINRLPARITRVTAMTVGLYRVAISTLEALTDTEGIDTHFIRRIRAAFDEKYTPEDLEVVERDMMETITKALFDAPTPDPTAYEAALKELYEMEKLLGKTVPETGMLYTLRDFASDIRRLTGVGINVPPGDMKFPPDMLTEDFLFSPLAVFYAESLRMFEEYETIPANERIRYREDNPETDARLLFWNWGGIETVRSREAWDIFQSIYHYYRITPLMMSPLHEWQD